MQKKIFPLIMFLGSAGYLYYAYQHRIPVAGPKEPPVLIQPREPAPIFTPEEIASIRTSIQDPDPEVRWTAINVLYNINDPDLPPILDHMIESDPDEDLRRRLIGLVKGHADLARLGGLVKGLSDVSKEVRIASLEALGDIGDPSVTIWILSLLKDPDPDVRIASLRALGKFQERRRLEFIKLTEKLRADYEEALRRSAAERR